MKKIFVILALISWIQTSAQEKERIETRGYIGLTMGPAFSLGNFAKKDISNEKSGYAKTGFNLSLVNFGYRFGKHFGISAAWVGAVNLIETKDFASLSSTPWSYGSLLVGGLYSKNIGNSYFDGKIMVGYAVTSNPDLGYLLTIESPASFAYMVGIGIRPRIGNRFTLNFTMDYFHTKPSFEENNFEQAISSFFVNGGFCYLLK